MSSISACGSRFPCAALWVITAVFAFPLLSRASQYEIFDSTTDSVTVTGQVIREDGTAPPFGVAIERDCGSGYRKEVYAEISGHFSFQMRRELISQTPSSTGNGDPSIWKLAMEKRETPPQFEMSLCLVRARFSGFRSGVVRLPGDRSAMNVDVGKIVLHPEKKNAAASVSLTVLQAPEKARKEALRAQTAIKHAEYPKARTHLDNALSLYPQFAEVWYYLGFVKDRLQLYPEAEQAFLKAVEIDPAYALPYLGLATAAWRKQDWPRMMEWSARCLKLQPFKFPEAYFLNAIALFRMNLLDSAEETARKGIQLDVSNLFAKIHLVLADILYSRKQVAESVQEMRKYLQVAGNAPNAREVRNLLQVREKESTRSAVMGSSGTSQ